MVILNVDPASTIFSPEQPRTDGKHCNAVRCSQTQNKQCFQTPQPSDRDEGE